MKQDPFQHRVGRVEEKRVGGQSARGMLMMINVILKPSSLLLLPTFFTSKHAYPSTNAVSE